MRSALLPVTIALNSVGAGAACGNGGARDVNSGRAGRSESSTRSKISTTREPATVAVIALVTSNFFTPAKA